MGFQFSLNADFVMVTNRESIQEDSEWNIFLRKKAAAFLATLFLSKDGLLRENVARFVPKVRTTNENSKWWNLFSKDACSLIQKALFDSAKARMKTEKWLKLFEEKWVEEKGGVEFIEESLREGLKIRELCCSDILAAIERDSSSLSKKDSLWWEKFFGLLIEELENQSEEKLREKLRESPIFLFFNTSEKGRYSMFWLLLIGTSFST